MFGIFKKSDAEVCMDKACKEIIDLMNDEKDELCNLFQEFKDRNKFFEHTHEAGDDLSKLIKLPGIEIHPTDATKIMFFLLTREVTTKTGLDPKDYSDKLVNKMAKKSKDLTEILIFQNHFMP
jgi:hypothetical protein